MVAADEFDPEAVVFGTGDPGRPSVEDLAAVATTSSRPIGDELRGRKFLAAEVAVHVRGRGVARLTGVDDDHRPTLATELEARRRVRGRTPMTATSQCRSIGAGGVVADARR